VIALPGNKVFNVAVVTGKVEVTAQNKAGKKEWVFLTPKEQASYSPNTKKIVQSLLTETQLKYQFWKPFSLSFGDAAMETVSRELEKAFQVKVSFSDPALANCHLRVDFNNQQLPEIMSLLEMLLDVNCELTEGNVLRITGEGCTN
jgi:ferric-dicitrate binding protein FerR (iron transport regulator)